MQSLLVNIEIKFHKSENSVYNNKKKFGIKSKKDFSLYFSYFLIFLYFLFFYDRSHYGESNGISGDVRYAKVKRKRF